VTDIRVEVVFALPERQELMEVILGTGSTVSDAIDSSGIREKFADFDLDAMPIAIWGRPAGRRRELADGDRVEILRRLEIDPRDARRELARDGQFMGGPVSAEDS